MQCNNRSIHGVLKREIMGRWRDERTGQHTSFIEKCADWLPAMVPAFLRARLVSIGGAMGF
jgi:hypothetical protein